MGWNWLDWALTSVVVFSMAMAALKGFIRELIALAAVLAGLATAALGYQRAAGWFEDLTRSHEVALGLGFLALFLGIVILGALVSILAKKLIQKAGLEWFDRFLGALFGLVRGIILCSIVLMVMLTFSLKPEVVRRSALAPYVVTGARVIVTVMPGELKSQFKEGFEKFRQALIENDKNAIKK